MKTHKNQYRILGTLILLTMLLALLFPTSTAFADDPTPPADTPDVVDPPAEEGSPLAEDNVLEVETPETEQPDEMEPAVEEPAIAEATTEESAIEDVASEEPAIDEPATEDATPEGPAAEETVVEESLDEDSAPEGEAETLAEPVLAQLPEGTDVVVLDDAGEVVPLATEEAAQAIATSDPMWCPDGVAPIANTNGCSNSYTSMTALLAALSGPNQPTQNGTIWIENTYNSDTAEPVGTTVVNINGDLPAYATWGNYSLTVQGGWTGTALGTISGTSLFSGDRLRIINWRNDVTIRDIIIDNPSGGRGLEIEIDPNGNAPNVTVENVEVNGNSSDRGAFIISPLSTGSVTVNNSTFTNNANDGLRILAMGNVTLQDVSATGNGYFGVQIYNTASSAAAPVQVLGTNVFTGNSVDGLLIRSNGEITLNNITAENNNGAGTIIDNSSSIVNANVTITGTNSFSGNADRGVAVFTRGAISLSNITANGNLTRTGAYLSNDFSGAVGGVTISGANSFNGNNTSGLVIDSRGAVSLNNITADGNMTANGVDIDNCIDSGGICQGSGDVTLTDVQALNNIGAIGLSVRSGGIITLVEVVASQNGQ